MEAEGKKRDFPWWQQQMMQGAGDWRPEMWNWDSRSFTARPVSGVGPEAEREMKSGRALAVEEEEEDGESLTLKLGGGTYAAVGEEAALVVRPSKRVRPGSPGGGRGGGFPMCQVDDCKADLSGAKDYHRRHKVCDLHSKAATALVGTRAQRFCQQCSRFHALSEFDEGKRSCRRRLAGHNRRRRKTQPENASVRLVEPGNQENSGSNNMDILSLLTILARLQGKSTDKVDNSVLDKDCLTQILSKINSLPTSNSSSRSNVPRGLDLNATQALQPLADQPNKQNADQSTMDLLSVLSAALATSSPDSSLGAVSQGSSNSSGVDNSNIACTQTTADVNLINKSTQLSPPIGAARSSSTLQSSVEVSDHQMHEVQPSLPLQLFSSTADDSPPKFGSKYLSSESSNPTDERSPSSSPPVAQKLFPLHSDWQSLRSERMPIFREDNMVEASTSGDWRSTVEDPERQVEQYRTSQRSFFSCRAGSNNSPPSSNLDARDRTGRIVFKLFDKDPSNFPVALRTQIWNWLSHCPSEMESYIRPGCVVLSIYASMPAIGWTELEESLPLRVLSLIQSGNADFWRSGRFLVQTNKKLVSHKDGKVRLCKSWSSWSAPELTSVSPLAVANGKKTSLILRGRNLTVPGTKVYCTYMGGYTSKELLGSSYPGTIYDDFSLESFNFPGGLPSTFGRCFIEVENGFKGNSFPLIIADEIICQELRVLEPELEVDKAMTDSISDDQVNDCGNTYSREDVLHFLNELGWLFQKTSISTNSLLMEFSASRFKFLFIFSVDRDWCALIKTLIDIIMERSPKKNELVKESLEMLSEFHLLGRAVKRKCRNMVNLLINYSVFSDHTNGSKVFLFPPNSSGPGGVTPLHLVASMEDSDDMVDTLTNDPQEIGLNCWNSVQDDSGNTPFAYASMRNNHAYNILVARKLTDRKNGQLSMDVRDDGISLDNSWILEDSDKPHLQPMQVSSCAQCAMLEANRVKRIVHTRGLLDRPYVHSMLAIAAVCVCVCLFIRGMPDIGSVAPFKWENLDFGPR